ncbi:hypothetical protein ACS0TY_014739 [Phlomoides rotata]
MLDLDSIRSFIITADDVHDVFMLPRNPGVPVVKYGKKAETSLLLRVKEKYGVHPSSPMKCLEDAFREKFKGEYIT